MRNPGKSDATWAVHPVHHQDIFASALAVFRKINGNGSDSSVLKQTAKVIQAAGSAILGAWSFSSDRNSRKHSSDALLHLALNPS